MLRLSKFEPARALHFVKHVGAVAKLSGFAGVKLSEAKLEARTRNPEGSEGSRLSLVRGAVAKW